MDWSLNRSTFTSHHHHSGTDDLLPFSTNNTCTKFAAAKVWMKLWDFRKEGDFVGGGVETKMVLSYILSLFIFLQNFCNVCNLKMGHLLEWKTKEIFTLRAMKVLLHQFSNIFYSQLHLATCNPLFLKFSSSWQNTTFYFFSTFMFSRVVKLRIFTTLMSLLHFCKPCPLRGVVFAHSLTMPALIGARNMPFSIPFSILLSLAQKGNSFCY